MGNTINETVTYGTPLVTSLASIPTMSPIQRLFAQCMLAIASGVATAIVYHLINHKPIERDPHASDAINNKNAEEIRGYRRASLLGMGILGAIWGFDLGGRFLPK
jgi:hypothetical protein